MPVEEHTAFMDEFNHHIFEMVSSTELNERKGGILAIGLGVFFVSFVLPNLIKHNINVLLCTVIVCTA